jgi:uncharacterized protein (TIGR03435 family)
MGLPDKLPRRRLVLLSIAGVALIAVVTLPAFGQQSRAFDVASVKPTASTDGRALLQATPGRLAMTNLTLRRLILIAFGLQDYQLAGFPAGFDSENYDIEAKAEGNPSVQQIEGPMLQALLQERFRLSVHRETRQLAVYKLSLAKSGPKLQASQEGSCIPYVTSASPPTTAKPGEPRPNFCGFQNPKAEGLNRTLNGLGVTMADLAKTLSRNYTAMLGRNVIDETGLPGTFDLRLTWAMESDGSHAADVPPADATGPSIFTALQEQLGLRLEPAKGPVEVLVIDHVEKPSGN